LFSKWLPGVSYGYRLDDLGTPGVSYGCRLDDLGTRWIRTADPGIAGLVTYPLDHEVLVDMTISELPDEL